MDLSQEDWVAKQKELSDVVILDVRSEAEFEDGHIPNAELLNIQDPHGFMEGLSQLDTSKSYFVYCRSGARSAQACMLMKQEGLDTTYNLIGGILEWKGAVV